MVGRRAVEARLRLQLQAQGDGFLLARRLPFEDAQRSLKQEYLISGKPSGSFHIEILGRELHSTVGVQQLTPTCSCSSVSPTIPAVSS